MPHILIRNLLPTEGSSTQVYKKIIKKINDYNNEIKLYNNLQKSQKEEMDRYLVKLGEYFEATPLKENNNDSLNDSLSFS